MVAVQVVSLPVHAAIWTRVDLTVSNAWLLTTLVLVVACCWLSMRMGSSWEGAEAAQASTSKGGTHLVAGAPRRRDVRVPDGSVRFQPAQQHEDP
jgi:hypothetical protein